MGKPMGEHGKKTCSPKLSLLPGFCADFKCIARLFRIFVDGKKFKVSGPVLATGKMCLSMAARPFARN